MSSLLSAGTGSTSTPVSLAKLSAARLANRFVELGKVPRDQRCCESPALDDSYRYAKRARTSGCGQQLEVFDSTRGEAQASGAPSHSRGSSYVFAAQPASVWSAWASASNPDSSCGMSPERGGRACHPFPHTMTVSSAVNLAPGQLPGTSPEGRSGVALCGGCASVGGATARSSWRFAGSAPTLSTCRDEEPLPPAHHRPLRVPACQPPLISLPAALQPSSHGSSCCAMGAAAGGVVRLSAAQLAALTCSSEAALRRSLEASHQSFLQHQQQHSASVVAQAWSRRPLLLGPSAGASASDSFPFARASSHSSSDFGSCCVASGCNDSCDVASASRRTFGNTTYDCGGGSRGSSPLPVAPPTPTQLRDLAPRECILLTCRGLCLSADTTGRLALHIWTRVEPLARLLLSVRPDATAAAAPLAVYGCRGAGAAAAGLQVYAVAAVWVAAKLEERRQEVPGSGALAVAARSSPAALAAAELRILQWCDWAPYTGFVPDESHLLVWAP
ncbi:hypothetical protein CHLRE_06g289050v5 [Chlamydomonas reinhardtii]|uniref:Uncharacterized protein n=1 Tax=Chlamydomonas reinhardtii TaxID=3055 RepID=A0A2K3DQ56_CHLRE|nr:uncharacterized protein CHLRE_06g289050v5 [Chlamydomonas reinhardtii]PNW82676.1 hypothetical protein CHLRE_06g289050v5 [Chlamydomonas reinhardtii]